MLAYILDVGFQFDLQHTVSAVIDAGCVAVIGAVIAFLGKMFKTIKLLQDTNVDILAEKIERKITNSIDRGYIYSEELKSLEKLYKRYKSLEGNGYIDELMKQVSGIKVQPGPSI